MGITVTLNITIAIKLSHSITVTALTIQLNEHFEAHMQRRVTQHSLQLCRVTLFHQLIHHSNSAQSQPVWFMAETVTSIRINSHICTTHTPPLGFNTILKLKQ